MKKAKITQTNSSENTHKTHGQTAETVHHKSSQDLSSIAVDSSEVSSLLFMIEEEKMARDIYDALYEQTGLIEFDKISNSEQKHYDTLLKTADKLGIDISYLASEAGIFNNTEIQNLYDQLIAQGSISADAAIDVGIAIETTDIADLNAAINTTEITLLGHVYNNLLNGSLNHLSAFEGIA